MIISHKIISTIKIILFLLLLLSTPVLAWNAIGHRIIGEIAYQHLSPKAKIKADQLIDYLSNAYPYSSTFSTANAWADYIKQDDIHVFDTWHFYDRPYYSNNTANKNNILISENITPHNIPSPNLLWAINQSVNILKSPKSNQYERALFLRFLLHFVGDAHQPLHCIDRFSKNFPDGDAGGNLLRIQTPDHHYYKLHAFWDNGLGLFDQSCGWSLSRSTSRRVKCLAEKFQTDYPESFFGKKTQDLNPQDWMNESYALAVSDAYNIPGNHLISQNYIQKNQLIAEQQVVLAGYRLANLLNIIYQ